MCSGTPSTFPSTSLFIPVLHLHVLWYSLHVPQYVFIHPSTTSPCAPVLPPRSPVRLYSSQYYISMCSGTPSTFPSTSLFIPVLHLHVLRYSLHVPQYVFIHPSSTSPCALVLPPRSPVHLYSSQYYISMCSGTPSTFPSTSLFIPVHLHLH